jgi:hypothetical protein
MAAVVPKSYINSFLELYRLILARQYPSEEPMSPALETVRKLGGGSTYTTWNS